MLSYNNVKPKNITYNGQKVKKWTNDGVRIYNAGGTVTYYIDAGVSYKEEVDSGATCLSPKTFTPSKSGWTFVGWREDKMASSSVLTSKVMGDSPITLYAVFSRTLTLSYAGNGATSGSTTAQTGTQYYNFGNYANPSFALRASGFTRVGYSFTKWALGSASGTQYAAGASVTLAANTTFYALWKSEAFYWVQNSVVQSGYPSSYIQSYLNYSNAALNNTLVDFDLVGVQEGNTTFRGTTATVNTKGNKYMEVKVGSDYAMSGRLDSFTIAGTNYAGQIASGKTLTIDVSNYSTVSIYLDVTAWAWGNHASIPITSIRFYS